MHPRCKQAVQQAAGRALTDSEIKKIDDSISATMRRLARDDPAGWSAKSADQRVLEAATVAMQDIAALADLKVQRAQLQVLKTAAMESRVGDLMANYAMGRNAALVRDMELTGLQIDAIKGEALGRMMSLLDAVTSKDGAGVGRRGLMFLFDAENPAMSRDLAREIFNNADGATGNQLAQKGARAWLDNIETLRQRFNDGGGDVGKLDYGYLPQPHDQGRVRGKGDASARDAWTQATLPLLDRSRYLQEDGRPMSDAQVGAVLASAWETIATGGINKIEPGKAGSAGAKANAGSESRQIHFKDADSYLAYMAEYGGGGMHEAMIGHVSGMARDIGLVERYGPNPEQQMRLQFDLAKVADGKVKRSALLTPQAYWNTLSGFSGSLGETSNTSLAAVGQFTRNLNTMGKLAGATISSLTDVPTYFITTGYNKLSYWDAIKNIGKATGKETKDFLAMHGVIAESMISDLNRWSGDNINQSFSGRLANSTLKLSLMNAWTDTLRNAFALTHMNGLAKMAETDWARLTEYDRSRMTRKGITENDWNVIRQADLTEYNGQKFLTPESIRASAEPGTPQVDPGHIRYYHGGNPRDVTGKLWFTSSLRDAEGWANRDPSSMRLWYVDVPVDHPARGGDDAYGVLPSERVEFPAEIASHRKEFVQPGTVSSDRSNEVVAKVLGMIKDESEYAVLNPDLATRTMQTWGGKQRGTVDGELARSVMQFKSFPIAMMTRHWRRMLETPQGMEGAPVLANKLAYSSALMVSLTAFGAIVAQTKEILNGRDPIDMTTGKFWLKAFTQGGGAGFLGDVLLRDSSSDLSPQQGLFELLGPTAGTGAALYQITKGNIDKAAAGKPTHAGAQAVNLARANLPYLNLWYLKAAINHMGLHALQENLSPGYLGRMQQRAHKEWGQDYWWKPGTGAPDRAPDFAKTGGN